MLSSFTNKVSAQDSKTGETLTPTFWGDWETGLRAGNGVHNWYGDPHIMSSKYASYPDSVKKYSYCFYVVKDDSAHARQGKYYAHVEVRPGDDPRNDGTQRSEVIHMQKSNNKQLWENYKSGTVEYQFSIKLDTTWQIIHAGTGWCSFVQLHGDDNNGFDGGPAWFVGALDNMVFQAMFGDGTNPGTSGPRNIGPLNIGHWIDFRIRQKFAYDNTGFIHLDRRDEGQTDYTRMVTFDNTPTLQWGTKGIAVDSVKAGHYMKTGIYKVKQNMTSIVYLDGFTRYVVTDIATGIAPQKPKSDLLIYPNPVEDNLKIMNAQGFTNFGIYDMTGKVVYIQENNKEEDVSVNIAGLNSGMYFLKGFGKNSSLSQAVKFIKK
jgi:hypothetical protein